MCLSSGQRKDREYEDLKFSAFTAHWVGLDFEEHLEGVSDEKENFYKFTNLQKEEWLEFSVNLV